MTVPPTSENSGVSLALLMFTPTIFSKVSVRFAFAAGSVSICDLAWHIPEGLALSRHMYKHIHVLFGVFGRLARFGIYCLVALALSKPMHRAVDNIGKAVGERQDAGAHTIANASHDVSTRISINYIYSPKKELNIFMCN